MNLTLALIATMLCTVYSLACLGLGLAVLRVLGLHLIAKRKMATISGLSVVFLLGSGSISTIWSIFLSLGSFNLKIIIGILSLCLISAVVLGRQFANGAKNDLKNIWKDFVDESFIWKIVILLTLLTILQRGLSCLLPLHPLGDGAAFYMVVPKLLAYTKKFVLLGGYERAMTLGFQGELHFAALMSLGSDWMAKLLTWPISLVAAFALAGLASLTGVGRRGQWLVISMVFTSTAFTLLIGDGKVDIFGAAMGIAALYWVFLSDAKSDGVPNFVTGLLTGFAIVAKISYLPSIISCITLLIFWRHWVTNGENLWKADSLINLAEKYLWLVLGMSLPIGVHLIKNWVLIGEPFAPFVFLKGNPFGGTWTKQIWYTPKVIKKIILTYPLALTYGKYPMQYGTMSTMVLAFIPLVLLVPKSERLTRSSMFQITIMGLLGVVIWKLIRPGVFAPRYILYTLMFLIPLAAGCAEYMSRMETGTRWFATLIVGTCIVSLCINIKEFGRYNFNGHLVDYISGRRDDSAVIGPAYRAAEKLNNTAAVGEEILSLTFQTYYFRPDLLASLSNGRLRVGNFVGTHSNITSEEVWKFIDEEGFNYIFLDQITHSSINKYLDLKQVPDWLEVEIIFEEKDYMIYRLSAKGAEGKDEI